MTGEQKPGGLEVVAWPVVTDQWAETYCELTGRDPDGQHVTFVDGGTVTTFRDMARREIKAMLCAAPKSAVRTIATAEPAEARIRELELQRDEAVREALNATPFSRDEVRQMCEQRDELIASAEARATAAEAKLARAVGALVEAAIPLEAILMSGRINDLSPDLQAGVQRGVVAVRASLQQEGE